MIDFILKLIRKFSLVDVAYNAFEKSVTKKATALLNGDDIKDCFIALRKNNTKAEAYVVKVYTDGRKTQTKLDESIDLELLPKDYHEELLNNSVCRIVLKNNKKHASN